MIKYTITSHHPSSHIFNVSLSFTTLNPRGQQLIMPCWIPGSYMIRDFAKHVVQLRVANGYAHLYQISKINSYTWQLESLDPNQQSDQVTIEYEVYAWDRSVRGAHLDTTHAFINFSCLSLLVVGQQNSPHFVQICLPTLAEKPNWTLATTLHPEDINPQGFGLYSAQNYDELIDHPIEMGCIERVSFLVKNIVHEIVLSGTHYGDVKRLKQDVQKICEVHHNLFNNHLKTNTPFEKYCFLLTLTGEGYGGLEHRSSTALLSPRNSMPGYLSTQLVSLEYQNLLALFSHEYFHAWNIKRIKPSEFCPYDLVGPQYTKQLWAFEGITSYYDSLALVRAGVITPQAYFQILSDKITKLKATPGQTKQTLVESSFDAWIKFYKPDENTPNSSISYYLKGLLVAFCFDMVLRSITNNQVSLDDVMRELWLQYGEDQGVVEGEIEKILIQKANHSEVMKQWIHQALYTTQELALQQALEVVGLQLNFTVEVELVASLGMVVAPVLQELQIMTVFENSAAMIAGLSAKDTLVAINNIKINNQQNLERLLTYYKPGDVIFVHVFREDKLMNFTVTIPPIPENKAQISINENAIPDCLIRRNQWLGIL